MRKHKLIIFNFGISDDMEILVIDNGSIIYAGDFHGTAFEDCLKSVEDHKQESYCYLPKIAYARNNSGISCYQILINSGFRVA